MRLAVGEPAAHGGADAGGDLGVNDVGPGLGQVGATESFEIVNPLGRFVLTVCMLLGRLEIFTVLALLSPAFWRR